MPWVVGLDEAGYGPNLGPFVMSAVALRVPDTEADVWGLLRRVVRRHNEGEDDRLVVDDSKLVYSSRDGLAALERGVRALVPGLVASTRFDDGLALLCPRALDALRAECWFTGSTPLPWGTAAPAPTSLVEELDRVGMSWGIIRSQVVCAAAFNDLLDQTDSKGQVLSHCLASLVAEIHAHQGDTEPTCYFIDKHGGRNYYAALVQHALPGGLVVALRESANESSYRVLGLGREVRLTFLPRADTAHFCVALASMVSKYLRELFMLEWNAWWIAHVPGLKPTAGYPGDAARFFQAIRPIADRLGISERALWRRK